MNMSRFEPYLGAATVLLLGVCAVILANAFADAPSSDTRVASKEVTEPSAFVLPELSVPGVTLPSLSSEVSVTATTAVAPVATTSPASTTAVTTPRIRAQKTNTDVKAASTSPSVIAVSPVSAPLPIAAPAQPSASSGNASLDAAASTLRNALVNIICYAPSGGKLHSISGSGVIIDPKGIILTNAHIGQYFLLADKDVDCTIRTGNPAVPSYEASLIYISPSWIRANTTVLTQTAPTGTGEYDFAFLAITKSATASPLPSSFPTIRLADSPVPTGTPIVIASYGAQFLEASQIRSALYPTVVFGSIKDVFTFALNTIDVLALGGSAAAQEGSSGGGVADASGTLVGTITTSTVEGATDTRNLDAISASYIRAQFAREMGDTLDSLLNESTSDAVAEFEPQISLLEPIVSAQLQ